MIPLASSSSSSGGLIDSVVDMPGRFADVAMHDPLSAVLLALGTLIIALSVGVFGYLSAGAALSLVTVEETPQPPRRVE